MKKIFYLLLFVSIFAISANAQVKIGGNAADTPDARAILELKSDSLGFLLPRIALQGFDVPAPLTDHVPGMVVYNTRTDSTGGLFPGLYYNIGTQWIRLANQPKPNWFYLPSVPINVETTGTGRTLDLHAVYATQLGTPGVKSTSAPTGQLTPILDRDKLHYYVTGYDHNVFNNILISDTGVMTYDVIGQASDSTYMNIVFVEK